MNKKFFTLFFVLSACSAVFFQSGSLQAVSYESRLEAELDLGVVERSLKTVFDFFDQTENEDCSVDKYQELMYELIILPMYKSGKGSYKSMIRSIKSAEKAVSSILKRLKKAGAHDLDFVEKRQKGLKRLLVSVRKKRGLTHILWASAEIECRYGELISSYKAISEKTEHMIVQDREFEKELLYTSFNLVAHKQKKYPMVHFMRDFLSRDIKRHKRRYDRAVKLKKSGFAKNLFEKKYHDLTLIKTSVESLDAYNKEKKALSKSNFRKTVFGAFCVVAPLALALSFYGHIVVQLVV